MACPCDSIIERKKQEDSDCPFSSSPKMRLVVWMFYFILSMCQAMVSLPGYSDQKALGVASEGLSFQNAQPRPELLKLEYPQSGIAGWGDGSAGTGLAL